MWPSGRNAKLQGCSTPRTIVSTTTGPADDVNVCAEAGTLVMRIAANAHDHRCIKGLISRKPLVRFLFEAIEQTIVRKVRRRESNSSDAEFRIVDVREKFLRVGY
jgi:hypothetical protein